MVRLGAEDADPKRRTLLKVMLVPEGRVDTQRSVERLMQTGLTEIAGPYLGNLEKLKQPAIAGIFGVNSAESNREQTGIIGGQIWVPDERWPFFEVPFGVKGLERKSQFLRHLVAPDPFRQFDDRRAARTRAYGLSGNRPIKQIAEQDH
jgi:hypothetical protein